MASSQSLPAFQSETELLQKDSSHTKTGNSEASLETSGSAGNTDEASFPKVDSLTDSGPFVVKTDSVHCHAVEEVAGEEEQKSSFSPLHSMPLDEARSSAASTTHGILLEENVNTTVASLHIPTEEEPKRNVSMEFVTVKVPKETLETVEAHEGFDSKEGEHENGKGKSLEGDEGFQNSEQPKAEGKEKNEAQETLGSVGTSQTSEKPESEWKNGASEDVGKLMDVSVASSADATDATEEDVDLIVDDNKSIDMPSNSTVNLINNITEHSSILETFEDDTKLIRITEITTNSIPSEALQEKIEITNMTDVAANHIADSSNNNCKSSENSDMAVMDDVAHHGNSAADQSLEEIKGETESKEELEAMEVPTHWHPKPCVHISCVGGSMTEEELLPTFSKYGSISSVSFENERHDSALLRYELHLENTDDFLGEVRQATNNTKLGDKTIIVEPFRPDSLLFVGNLTPSIDDSSLKSMFDAHGKIERGFVLQNAEGKSKCYGFVEYSLKSQATAAKVAMGNINMDGRVLRVEWSDCKKVSDMFSTVLFVDRLPREGSNLDTSLQELFGKFGKIRDSHLAIGIGNQYRGFAFVDFYNSACADKAHQALDGCTFQGSNIRVSFANPSKSTQSYKFRYGTQAGQSNSSKGGASGSGMVMAPSLRGSPVMPFMQPRFMGPSRPGMMGYGIGMQFGRGAYERVPMHGSGIGMLGPGGRTPLLYGNVPSRPRMSRGENNMQRMQAASINPSAIVQVATAQAKAREEEARARAEAAKQGLARSGVPADFPSADRYQRFQDSTHQVDPNHAYYQAQRQQSIHHQQASLHQQRPGWNQQQGTQIPQSQGIQYHQRASQSYSQQQPQATQQMQHLQHQQYIQHQQHGYPQHGQQAYQSGQPGNILYNTQMPQYTGQQYQQQQTVYPLQSYGEQYAQVQAQTQAQTQPQAQAQPSQPTYTGVSASLASSGTVSGSQDAAQQAYAAYYQQQAQATQQQASGVATVTTATTDQQSYEAQWAAYYASQAAYQQQTPTADVGQKRAAEQMDSYQQNQATTYNYAVYSQDAASYQQQPPTQSIATSFQQPSDNVTSYQQQQTTIINNTQYQQQQVYQQASTQYTQASTVQSGYEQAPIPITTDPYQQQATESSQQVGPTGQYDYSKRPRY